MPTNSLVIIEHYKGKTVNRKTNKKPKQKPKETGVEKKLSPVLAHVNTCLHRGPPSAADDRRNHQSPL
jgi:hypothetical protein